MNGLQKDSGPTPDIRSRASDEREWLKQRTLTFRHSAFESRDDIENKLRDIRQSDGVKSAKTRSNDRLSITYDLRVTNLEKIIEVLTSAGITLGNSIYLKLRRFMIHYIETIQQENATAPSGWHTYVRDIYVSRYQARRHGARDDRPQQWRKYLHSPIDDR